MNDNPNDHTPDASGVAAAPPTPGTAWQPSTDAGTETADVSAAVAQPKPKRAARRAPSGDDVQRRRPANVKPTSEGAAQAVEPASDAAVETDAPAAASEETHPGERIAKAMARSGIASRRDAEAMILEGRVSVNGETIASPALNVTDSDVIVIDGEPMPARERSRLWIFHKPRGLVTTARDPEGRQTVFEVLPEDLPRVVAIGRLDINTEGLLLLTNDGGLAKVIAHPDTGWLRRYRVRAHGDTDQAQLDRLSGGLTIDGMEYGPIEAHLDRVQGDNLWLTLGLREGKNREVKRILEHLGLSVNRLIRLSFGPFQLGDLEVGLVEEVKTRVLKDQLGKTLAQQAGVDFESPVREAIAPFGASARENTARPKSSGGARGGRDAARPAPTPRVATGGSGSGPRRSAWSAESDTQGPRAVRVPRRGGDPRAAQAAAAAERGRERVGSIQAGERRVVVERLSATPPQPVVEEAPRRRYADRGTPDRPPRDGNKRSGGETSGGWGQGRGEARPRNAGASRDAGRPLRDDTRGGGVRGGDRRGGQPDPRRDGASGTGGDERPVRGRGDARPAAGYQGRGDGAPPRGRAKEAGGYRGKRDHHGQGGDQGNDGAPARNGARGRTAASGGAKPAFGDRATASRGGKPGFGAGKAGFGKPGGKGGFGKPGSGGARSAPRAGGKPGGQGGGFRGGAKPGGSGRPPRGGR